MENSYCSYSTSLELDNVHKIYHDTQYGFPIHDDNQLFGRLILEINQAGLSWETILKKQHNFELAYDQFDIQKIAFSSTIFGKIEDLTSQEIDGKTINFTSLWVDAEFVDLYNLQLVKGRFFSKELRNDENSTVLLNEAAVREFGVEDPFTIEIRVPGGRAKVIGIVKDFNYKVKKIALC